MYHKLHDNRVNCVSVLIEMALGEYIALVEKVYEENGGIEGQRGPLKTKTGITIRKRLVADIQRGAVMPPVVLGLLVSNEEYPALRDAADFEAFMRAVEPDGERLSVIDGMQRTTAMLDAVRTDPSISDNKIRVEFWVSDDINSLIYRMLVLNTGQVPWEIGRQLETVYSQFMRRIRQELGGDIEIFFANAERRRVQAGQYQSKNIVELLLLFSSRRSELDIKDKVAEDFARLDAIETTAHSDFLNYFIETLRMLGQLDRQFGRAGSAPETNTRLRSGKDVFSSFPAMAGFCAAASIEMFDEPGFETNWQNAPEKMDGLVRATNTIVEKLTGLDDDQIQDFLQLDLLEQRLSQRSGQVGRFEREFFRKAFSAMFRNAGRLPSMAPCWMA